MVVTIISLNDKIPKHLLYEYEAKQEWLRHDSDLHGVAHMMRVFILQELICDQLERDGVAVDREATRFAASVHDVGRIDDGIDPDHGRRSAAWMKQNAPPDMSPETLDTATYIVHWHVPPDDDAPVMTTELQVMKDADGLDRVRLGDLNEAYLRTDAAKSMVEIARQLYALSQPSNQDKKEALDTVFQAAIRLGLVKA